MLSNHTNDILESLSENFIVCIVCYSNFLYTLQIVVAPFDNSSVR